MKVSTAALITIKSKSLGYYEEKKNGRPHQPKLWAIFNHLHGNISVETFPSTDRLQYCVFKSEFRISLNKHLQESKIAIGRCDLSAVGFFLKPWGESFDNTHDFRMQPISRSEQSKLLYLWPDTQGNIVCNARSMFEGHSTKKVDK